MVAWNLAEYAEHALIEHVPRAHLLLDHLFAGISQHPGLQLDLLRVGESAADVKGFPALCQAALRRAMGGRRPAAFRRAAPLYGAGRFDPLRKLGEAHV